MKTATAKTRRETAAAAEAAPPQELIAVAGAAAPSAALLLAVREAVEANVQDLEAYGDDRSGEGSYRDVAFTFVCALRAHPELAHLTADEAADAIEPALTALLESGAIEAHAPEVLEPSMWVLALGETDAFDHVMDPCEKFISLWETVRPQPGIRGAVREAQRREAEGDPARFGRDLASPRYRPRREFLGVCRVLAAWSEEGGTGGVFPLALEPLARALGWPRQTVGDWRKWAEDAGYLSQMGEPVRGLAARYSLGPALETSGDPAVYAGGPDW